MFACGNCNNPHVCLCNVPLQSEPTQGAMQYQKCAHAELLQVITVWVFMITDQTGQVRAGNFMKSTGHAPVTCSTAAPFRLVQHG